MSKKEKEELKENMQSEQGQMLTESFIKNAGVNDKQVLQYAYKITNKVRSVACAFFLLAFLAAFSSYFYLCCFLSLTVLFLSFRCSVSAHKSTTRSL